MATLLALAIVAQKAIPPEGHKAITTALIVADLERTRLAYERSRMMAEDQSVQHARLRTMEMNEHETIERSLANERDDALDEFYALQEHQRESQHNMNVFAFKI